jgi:AcrR family transcriptional regulator
VKTSRRPSQLPRGRHGLSRAEVEGSQRQRMLLGLVEAMAAKGYADTSVADIIDRAGVSRETFYEQFSSKQDCFLAAFDLAGNLFLGSLMAIPAEGAAEERLDLMLQSYLEALASQPAYARIFLVEVHAAGPEALRRRAALQQRFTDALVELLEIKDPNERLAVELLVAGIGSMVTTRLIEGDLEGLRGLREPVIELVRRALRG